MAADVLTPCIARPSATMIFTKQDIQARDFHKELFQLFAASQQQEMIVNCKYICMFPKSELSIKMHSHWRAGEC